MMVCNEEQEEIFFLSKEEMRIRDLAESRTFIMFLIGLVSSFKVFAIHLITFEAMFNVIITAAFTCLSYFGGKSHTGFLGNMDFVLLAFTIVLPLSATIRFAFRRREQALSSIAKFKSASRNLYSCHATWNWGKGPDGNRNSSSKDLLEHADIVLERMVAMGDALAKYLTLPTASLPVHRVMSSGRREASRTVIFANRLCFSQIVQNMTRLTLMLEDLKLAGLTPSETSRARQWEESISTAVEELRMVKHYRTPQGLRSFITVATFCLPPFYGPTFAAIGHSMNSLAMGLAFAMIASLALSCLHECVRALEDPFVGHLTLDGIDVNEELTYLHYENLMHTRRIAFPDASEFACDDSTDDKDSRTDQEEVMIVDPECGAKQKGKEIGELLNGIDKVASFSKDSNRRSRFNRHVSHATLMSQRTSLSKSSNASVSDKIKTEPVQVFNRTTSFTEFSDISGNENGVSGSLRSIGLLPNLKEDNSHSDHSKDTHHSSHSKDACDHAGDVISFQTTALEKHGSVNEYSNDETSDNEISIDHDLVHLEEGVPKLCMSNLLTSQKSIAFDSAIKSEPHSSRRRSSREESFRNISVSASSHRRSFLQKRQSVFQRFDV